MKKILTIIALVTLCAVGCKSKTNQEKLTEYQDTGRAIVEKFQKGEISEDEAVDQVVANALKAIKKNSDNEVAIAAFGDIWQLATPEQLQEAIESMTGENKENEDIKQAAKAIENKLKTSEGKPFIDFQVGDVKFSDYVGKGKYVLVDFWASWCGPCKQEIPFIKAVYEKYAGEKFDVLSIAVWDKPEDTEREAKAHGVVWNQIVDAQAIPTEIYGIEAIPQIILFGPDGTILKRNLRGENIEKEIAKYIND